MAWVATGNTEPDELLHGFIRFNNFGASFTFLRESGIEATNWPAEQSIRPAVANRKVWGGNRTLAELRPKSS